MNEMKMKAAKKAVFTGILRRFLIKVCVLLAAAILILRFAVGIYPCHGNYMYPRISDGDCCITLRIGGYSAGDVVTYRKEGIRYFGRIVGVPGDEILIGSSGLLINGMVPDEEVYYGTEPGDAEYPVTLAEDEYFILNDYRESLSDSRTFFTIGKSEFDGKVICLFRIRNI